MNKVVGTSYENCILWIQRDALTHVVTILHQESNCSTRHVELPLVLPANVNEMVLACDLIDAQDGGVAFLHVYDLMARDSEQLPHSFAERRKMLETYIEECYDHASPSSELRVIVPTLYDAQDIIMLYELVLPNSYGLLKGFRFVDNKVIRIKSYGRRSCKLHKTHLPDVYRVCGPGDVLPGNDIAYIGSADEAAKIARLFVDDVISIDCQWLDVRQKWTPILDIQPV